MRRDVPSVRCDPGLREFVVPGWNAFRDADGGAGSQSSDRSSSHWLIVVKLWSTSVWLGFCDARGYGGAFFVYKKKNIEQRVSEGPNKCRRAHSVVFEEISRINCILITMDRRVFCMREKWERRCVPSWDRLAPF